MRRLYVREGRHQRRRQRWSVSAARVPVAISRRFALSVRCSGRNRLAEGRIFQECIPGLARLGNSGRAPHDYAFDDMSPVTP
jgi:hypothetical protein